MRARLPRRVGQRHDQYDCKREGPHHQQEHTRPPNQPPGLFGAQGAEPQNQRDHHVGQHGHLEEPDEGVPDDTDGWAQLAEEDARGDAEEEADQDLRGEAHALSLSWAISVLASRRSRFTEEESARPGARPLPVEMQRAGAWAWACAGTSP